MEYVKKYWFVALVAVLFTAAIVYFAVDKNANTFKGKTVNGKDVLFEYNSQDVTADELFNEVFEDQAGNIATGFVQFGLYGTCMETTKELKERAAASAENALTYYKYTYGTDYEDYILPTLRAYGYDSVKDLEDYFVNYYKMVTYQTNYYLENTWEEFNKEKAPRILSHILVQMKDPENPTEEEQKKLDDIDAALKSGKLFAEVAKEFSEDTSAQDGGNLGYSDLDSNYVTEFKDAAMSLADGEVSGWVKTQFGRHIIKCDTCTKEGLKDDINFYQAIADYGNKDAEILKQLYDDSKIDYHGNDKIKEYIEKALKEEVTE